MFGHELWKETIVQRKDLGFHADFCPICREIRLFRRMEVSMVHQALSRPTGPATFLGHSILCESCHVESLSNHDQVQVPASTREVATATLRPIAEKAQADRIRQERLRVEGRLTAEDRMSLIREPFESLEYLATMTAHESAAVRSVTISTNIRSIALLCASVGLLSIGGVMISLKQRSWDPGPSGVVFGMPMIAVGFPLLVSSLHLFYTATQRHVREVIHPLLTRALAPMAPTLEELETALRDCRNRGRAIGRYLKPASLFKALRGNTSNSL